MPLHLWLQEAPASTGDTTDSATVGGAATCTTAESTTSGTPATCIYDDAHSTFDGPCVLAK